MPATAVPRSSPPKHGAGASDGWPATSAALTSTADRGRRTDADIDEQAAAPPAARTRVGEEGELLALGVRRADDVDACFIASAGEMPSGNCQLAFAFETAVSY